MLTWDAVDPTGRTITPPHLLQVDAFVRLLQKQGGRRSLFSRKRDPSSSAAFTVEDMLSFSKVSVNPVEMQKTGQALGWRPVQEGHWCTPLLL